MGYFTNLLTQNVILKKKNGTDSNGCIELGEDININCRIEFSSSVVIGSNAQQLTSSGRIFTEHEAELGDVLVIDNKQYTVIKVSPSFAFDGRSVLNEVNFQ